MNYQRDELVNTVKHLWKNEKVSFYARQSGSCYEIEIAFQDDCSMITYRLDNCASEEEALETIANLLEVFD